MIESGNNQKSGVDRVCQRIAEELRSCGAEISIVEMESEGNLLKAEWNFPKQPTSAGIGMKQPLLFLGHMDGSNCDVARGVIMRAIVMLPEEW